MTSSWTAPPLLARPACSAAERHPSDSRHGQWIFALGPRLARATAVAHGHQRSPAVIDVRRNRRSPALELTQLGRHERANQIVVPKVIYRRAEWCQQPGLVDGQDAAPAPAVRLGPELALKSITLQTLVRSAQ